MGELTNFQNGTVVPENDSNFVDRTEEMLMDVRKSSKPSNVSYSIPIAELSTLGSGISSMIPALNTITTTTTMGVDGLFKVVNSSAGDVLKVAKNGNFWGAIKTADGASKMAVLKAADPLTATTTTAATANPAILMMAAAIFLIEHELGKIEDMESR